MKVSIYGLCCPITGEIRYVGKTQKKLYDRLCAHIADRGRTHKTNWIKAMLSNGVKPTIELLEEVDYKEWPSEERFWISYLRFIGCKLTNIATGGLGGQAVSQETRQKMSQNRKGKFIGRKRTQKPRTPEHCARLSMAFKGRRLSQETKAKVGSARRAIAAAKKAEKLGPVFTTMALDQLDRAAIAAPPEGKVRA